jgi:Zn-dependent protease with chaperone function
MKQFHMLSTKISMKKWLASFGVMGFCLGLGVNHVALAIRYTQIYPNPIHSNVNPAPVQQPIQVRPFDPVYRNNPAIAATPVYQAQIRQALPLQTVRISQYATQPLQSPQAVLDILKSKNEVPADVAATIAVEKSNSLNAYTDGQKIVVTSSLLEKLTTNDERAFVISHELSHVLLSHIAKTQVRRVGLSLFDAFVVRRYVAQGSVLDWATQFGLGLVDKKSSRGYELQADDLGVRLMSQAGYDPEAAIRVFDILKANTPANQTPGFLLDHPITDDRIRALVQKYQLKPQ